MTDALGVFFATPFEDLGDGELFRAGGNLWRRVPKAVDRLGGYNAQEVGTGRRELFFMHQVVEVWPDEVNSER